MMQSHRSVQLGQPGVFECLQFLHHGMVASRDAVTAHLVKSGAHDPQGVLALLTNSGQLSEDRSGRLSLTQSGRRNRLLLAAVNGTPLEDVMHLLATESAPSPAYYLLTHDMTDHFVMNLHDRPDFARVYICSPWLAFERTTLDYLVHALALASRQQSPRLYVLTRGRQSPQGVDALRRLGADIVFREQLHTKLYIREPGPAGGPLLCVLGSQNLTRSKYIELGIAVRNDSVITSRLIAYFYMLHSMLDS